MRIAVISDSHLVTPSLDFVSFVEKHLLGADAILHCGDIVSSDTYHYLTGAHSNVIAVLGNCDEPALAQELPSTRTVELEGFTVGLAHGWGPRSQVPLAVLAAFGPEVDLVCFGHTHNPYWEKKGRVWLLNPGSIRLDGPKPSFAWLTLESGKEPAAEHVYFEPGEGNFL